MNTRTEYTVNHKVKTHPGPFSALWAGEKGHEIRANDRPVKYRVAHIVRLREYDPESDKYSGRAMGVIITHLRFAVGEGVPCSAGLMPGYVVFDFMILNYFRREDDPESGSMLPPSRSTIPEQEI
jgi:hypothetical protein